MTPSTPTISLTLEDRSLIELLYDPATGTTALAVCAEDGSTSIGTDFDLATGERLAPYSAANNLIAAECVLLPSHIGDFAEKSALLAEVRAFLHRYVDLPDTFEAIAAHYVLLTWVYDAFSDLPYLRLRGDFGTGKTRALLTVGSLCYKPFFASGASTVSPIFHVQDTFQGTLILDEADFRFSDASAQLTKILNNGSTRGMPVLRTMTNRNRELNPQAFRVFGPKIVAMREQFSDLALESRFLTHETSGRSLRADIPVHLPEVFKSEARELRNKLLAWRFRSRFSVGPDPSRQANDLAPRYRQSSLALLSLVDDPDLRHRITRALAGEEARVLQERADTLEAAMLSAIVGAFEMAGTPHAAVSEITERFNAVVARDLGRSMTNKWVGGFIRRALKLPTTKSNGVYVVLRTERPKVDLLAQRFGVGTAPAKVSRTSSPPL